MKKRKKKRVKGPILGWHFVAESYDGKLRLGYGDGREVVVGKWLKVTRDRYCWRPKLCHFGMHASRQILQAFSYKHGALCRVKVRGDIEEQGDGEIGNMNGKLVGWERMALHIIPAKVFAGLLHELAVKLARQALRSASNPYLAGTKRALKWLDSKRKGKRPDENLCYPEDPNRTGCAHREYSHQVSPEFLARAVAQFEKKVTAYVEKEMAKAKALRSASRTRKPKR